MWVHLSTYIIISDCTVTIIFLWFHFTEIGYWVSPVRQHSMDRNINKEIFLYKYVKLLSLNLKGIYPTVLTKLSRIISTNLHQCPGASGKPSLKFSSTPWPYPLHVLFFLKQSFFMYFSQCFLSSKYLLTLFQIILTWYSPTRNSSFLTFKSPLYDISSFVV